MPFKFLPWRLRWFFSYCCNGRFWTGFFNATAPTSKLIAVLAFVRAFIRRSDVEGLNQRPIRLKLRGNYEVELSGFSDLFIFCEIFVLAEYDWPAARTEPPPPDSKTPGPKTIVDIGANIGFFALRMKQLYPEAQIYCYEPFPPNFKRLHKLIRENQLSDCQATQKGVSGSSGQAELHIHDKNTGGHSILPDQNTDSSNVLGIELISLRDVFDGLNKPQIDILKLDCEGAEKDIILSLDAEQAANVKSIVFEPSPKLYATDILTTHLTALGYQTQKKSGLIFCHRSDNLE